MNTSFLKILTWLIPVVRIRRKNDLVNIISVKIFSDLVDTCFIKILTWLICNSLKKLKEVRNVTKMIITRYGSNPLYCLSVSVS